MEYLVGFAVGVLVGFGSAYMLFGHEFDRLKLRVASLKAENEAFGNAIKEASERINILERKMRA